MTYEEKVAKRMKERAERLRPPGYRDRVTAEAQAKQAAKEAGDEADRWLAARAAEDKAAAPFVIGLAIALVVLTSAIVLVLNGLFT